MNTRSPKSVFFPINRQYEPKISKAILSKLTKFENVFKMGPEPIKSMFDSINMHEKHKRNTKMIEIRAKNKVL